MHLLANFVWALLFTVLGLGVFHWSESGQKQPQFTALSADDAVRLDQQRAVIARVVKTRYGVAALTKTKADLPVLQRLIDDKVFPKTQTYELQCLGVVFGDVLASEYPLKWVMVTDEYGTDPTLRFKATSIQANALTMISKRIERGEKVNVQYLFDITGEQLPGFEKKLWQGKAN
jgi:hypothetical protein